MPLDPERAVIFENVTGLPQGLFALQCDPPEHPVCTQEIIQEVGEELGLQVAEEVNQTIVDALRRCYSFCLEASKKLLRDDDGTQPQSDIAKFQAHAYSLSGECHNGTAKRAIDLLDPKCETLKETSNYLPYLFIVLSILVLLGVYEIVKKRHPSKKTKAQGEEGIDLLDAGTNYYGSLGRT